MSKVSIVITFFNQIQIMRHSSRIGKNTVDFSWTYQFWDWPTGQTGQNTKPQGIFREHIKFGVAQVDCPTDQNTKPQSIFREHINFGISQVDSPTGQNTKPQLFLKDCLSGLPKRADQQTRSKHKTKGNFLRTYTIWSCPSGLSNIPKHKTTGDFSWTYQF